MSDLSAKLDEMLAGLADKVRAEIMRSAAILRPAELATAVDSTIEIYTRQALAQQALRTTEAGEVERPYAYEFGKSNGDGTYCILIEKCDRAYVDKFAVPDWPIKPLYAKPPAEGVKVRPLEWVRPSGALATETMRKVETIVGTYRVWTYREANGAWFWQLSDGASKANGSGTEQHCLADAEAHYQTRILSALEHQP